MWLQETLRKHPIPSSYYVPISYNPIQFSKTQNTITLYTHWFCTYELHCPRHNFYLKPILSSAGVREEALCHIYSCYYSVFIWARTLHIVGTWCTFWFQLWVRRFLCKCSCSELGREEPAPQTRLWSCTDTVGAWCSRPGCVTFVKAVSTNNYPFSYAKWG